MKVLGLMDSFKGTLTSIELGRILKKEFKKRKIECDYIPISDGGDGFLDVIEYIFNVKRIYCGSQDSLLRGIRTYYLLDTNSGTAYIELAKSNGLSNLKQLEYNPFVTSTYGTGKIILDAIKHNIKNIVIGIGGSSTNDGGSGILNALGVKFIDINKDEISYLCNANLSNIESLEVKDFNEITKNINFSIVSDVRNPLLGQNGATYSYALQKGALTSELSSLEANLNHYANLIETHKNGSFRNLSGSGAAGGVGFCFQAMFNARIESGINYILDNLNLEKRVLDYDYIITGEGKIDTQSLNGKVVFEILKRFKSCKVIFLSAINELDVNILKDKGVYKSYKIVEDITSKNQSMKYPRKYFKQLVRGIDL